MARKVQVHLLDDIDGAQADETLKFALDGTNYEIDLSTRHADKLRKSLEKYVQSARRVGRGQVGAAGRLKATAPARSDRVQNQAIRDWARRKGMDLSERGRIPRAVVEQYEVEAGR
ncbi:Lsr2 family protein [Rugosimonospora acidiphila]|uniref:Lsr2 family protein n=1 Tax=Rugosimonospora acidiphila TaxID=556531 RepID=A0ABP9RMQ5_9ACTN